jgi:hypothetical protein
MKLDISIKEIDGEGYLCIKLADLTVLKRSRAFKPPTIEQVREYCKERKNGIDAETFIAYYETRGWYLSKGVKMKSWKDAVITWEKNNRYNNAPKGTNLAQPPPEIFGLPNPKAITREQYLKQKL